MSFMSNKNVDEKNEVDEALAERPNWCVNCKTNIPDDEQFCSDTCLDEWDRKMERWRQDLEIENLIHDPKEICEPIFKDREHEKVNNLRNGKTLPLEATK